MCPSNVISPHLPFCFVIVKTSSLLPYYFSLCPLYPFLVYFEKRLNSVYCLFWVPFYLTSFPIFFISTLPPRIPSSKKCVTIYYPRPCLLWVLKFLSLFLYNSTVPVLFLFGIRKSGCVYQRLPSWSLRHGTSLLSYGVVSRTGFCVESSTLL